MSATPVNAAARLDRPFRLAGWSVDPPANEMTKGARTVRLEPKAMLLLTCLAGRPLRPATRETLIAAIWPDVVVGEDSLSRLVFQLRRAFGDDPRQPRVIETLPKVGYRLASAPFPARPPRPTAPTGSGGVARRSRLGAEFRQAIGPATLLAAAVLGCAFSSGWWSGRVLARRHRRPAKRPVELRHG